jgi:hypothetical protein
VSKNSQGTVRRRLDWYVSDLNRDGICGSISVLVRRRIVLGSNGLMQLLRDFGNRYDHCFWVDHNIVCNLIVDFSNSVDNLMKISSVWTRIFLAHNLSDCGFGVRESMLRMQRFHTEFLRKDVIKTGS